MISARDVKRMAVVAAMVLLAAGPARGAYITVYGGPTYDASTQTGYRFSGINVLPGSMVNDAGTAVGYAEKYDAGAYKGARAVRWDSSGAAATELGNLGMSATGVTYAHARAINASGTAVGDTYKYDAGADKGIRAVRWDASGTAATELGHLGTDASGVTYVGACAVNDAGTAVGVAIKYDAGADKGHRAVRWDASGTATELGNLGTTTSGKTDAYAYAVNDAGTAMGLANKQGARAVRWDASGTVAMELGNLGKDTSGVTQCSAVAVNDAGTAVGSAWKFDASAYKGWRAVRWDASGTAATELGILGTDATGSTDAQAYAINAAGTAVGWAYKYDAGASKGVRAVRWDASGTAATELGNLGTNASGVTSAQAYAINAAGAAVGQAEKYDVLGTYLGDKAVYWGLDGAAVDLNMLIDPASGWMLKKASAISDTGWIVGIGSYDSDGAGGFDAYGRLFLMQVPEPATMALLAVGGLALVRRRRKFPSCAVRRRKIPTTVMGVTLTMVLAMALCCPRAEAAVFDLNANWSDTTNPNGPWSYNEGNNVLSNHVNAWEQSLSYQQPAWADSETGTDRLPAWFKATGVEPGLDLDWQIGDIVVHTHDYANGVGNGTANLTWRSPLDGTADVSGFVWIARDIGRAETWALYLNEILLTSGEIFSGDPYDRANPFYFSDGSNGPTAITNLVIRSGDVLKLEFVSEYPNAGDFVGVNLTVTVVPEPATLSLLAVGIGGLMLRRRRK